MKNLGLAQSAGVQEDLAGSRIAGRIFIGQAKIECAERNPARFSAPAHVDDALAIGQQRFEPGTCLRGGLRLPPRDEGEGTGLDADEGQSCLSQSPNAQPYILPGIMAHTPLADLPLRGCAPRSAGRQASMLCVTSFALGVIPGRWQVDLPLASPISTPGIALDAPCRNSQNLWLWIPGSTRGPSSDGASADPSARPGTTARSW